MSKRPAIELSLCDTDGIVRAVKLRAPKFYNMNLPLAGSEARWVRQAVNQGIDSHLEACYVPDRGDCYKVTLPTSDIQGQVRGACLVCNVSRESLPVLVRRLLTMEQEETPSGDCSMLLASSICTTLGIECI